jgi:hypothetical protein
MDDECGGPCDKSGPGHHTLLSSSSIALAGIDDLCNGDAGQKVILIKPVEKSLFADRFLPANCSLVTVPKSTMLVYHMKPEPELKSEEPTQEEEASFLNSTRILKYFLVISLVHFYGSTNCLDKHAGCC